MFASHRRLSALTVFAAALFCASVLPGVADASLSDVPATDESSESLDNVSLVFRDGDSVVFGPSENEGTYLAKEGDGSSSNAPVIRNGFSTFGDARVIGAYEVRLVASPGIEAVRRPLANAVNDVIGVGQPMSMRPGTIGSMGPSRGQIDVVVSSSSPCTGWWLACGGPTIVDGDVVSGQIWVNPRLFGKANSEIANTIRHELGHTLGLAHFGGPYEGSLQVMHPTRFDAVRYQSGDRRGLAWVGTRSTVNPDIRIESVRYAAGRLDVIGRTTAAPGDSTVVVRMGDVTRRVPIEAGRFRVASTQPGGRVVVCSAIQDGVDTTVVERCVTRDLPMRPFGSFEVAQPGTFSVLVAGWAVDPQTADPVDVIVAIDGIQMSEVARQTRADVARAHPGYGPNHGFRITRTLLPGTHEVCVVIRNVAEGRDRPMGCRTVEVGRSLLDGPVGA